jgi:hypothetical protein
MIGMEGTHTIGSELFDLLGEIRATNKANDALFAKLDEGFLHGLGDFLSAEKEWYELEAGYVSSVDRAAQWLLDRSKGGTTER